MKSSNVVRIAVIAVIALAVALPASSAWGDVVLRRDGSKAVPFRAYPASGSSHQVALRRDGSKADPFVADLSPTGAPAAADDFDWGDAAIGLGAGLLVGMLGFAAIGAYGGRRAQTA
jgi:hypothetical protein